MRANSRLSRLCHSCWYLSFQRHEGPGPPRTAAQLVKNAPSELKNKQKKREACRNIISPTLSSKLSYSFFTKKPLTSALQNVCQRKGEEVVLRTHAMSHSVR